MESDPPVPFKHGWKLGVGVFVFVITAAVLAVTNDLEIENFANQWQTRINGAEDVPPPAVPEGNEKSAPARSSIRGKAAAILGTAAMSNDPRSYEFKYEGHACFSGNIIDKDPSIPLMCAGYGDLKSSVSLKEAAPGKWVVELDGKTYDADQTRRLLAEKGGPNYNASAATCGGVSLRHGYCALYETGRYVRFEAGSASPEKEPTLPTIVEEFFAKNHKKGEAVNSSSSSSGKGKSSSHICRDPWEMLYTPHAGFVRSGIGNPKTVWTTEGGGGGLPASKSPKLNPEGGSCAMLSARQPLFHYLYSEHKALRNARIVVMGDSHIRNLFSGFIVSTRNQEYLAEGHTDKNIKAHGIILHYRLWVDKEGTPRDSLEYIFVGDDGKSPEGIAAKEMETECKGLHRCIIVVYVWGARMATQLKSLGFVKQANPTMIVWAMSNYVGNRVLTPEYIKDMGVELHGISSLRTAVFYHWVWGNATPKKFNDIQDIFSIMNGTKIVDPQSGEIVASPGGGQGGTVNNSSSRTLFPIQSHYIGQDSIINALNKYGEEGVLQIRNTWHTLCQLHDTYPNRKWKVLAFDECTSLCEKTAVRSILTLGFSDVLRAEAAAAH